MFAWLGMALVLACAPPNNQRPRANVQVGDVIVGEQVVLDARNSTDAGRTADQDLHIGGCDPLKVLQSLPMSSALADDTPLHHDLFPPERGRGKILPIGQYQDLAARG